MDAPLVATVKEPVEPQPSSKSQGEGLCQCALGFTESHGNYLHPRYQYVLKPQGCGMKPESRPKDSGGTADGEAQPGFYHWDHTPPTHLLLRAPPHPCTTTTPTPRLPGAGEVVKLNVSCDLGQPYFSAGWDVSGSSWQPGLARGSGEGSGRRGDGGAPECRPGK